MAMLSRRDFIRDCAVGAAALALPALGRAQVPAPPGRPNIIVILLDDLGYGQFGPLGDTFTADQINPAMVERFKGRITPEAAMATARSAVPNITRLAAEGARFTDAYVTSSLCAPSRSALMTSCYPQRMGFYNNLDVSKSGVPAERPLLAQYLQKAGYATAMIGKWHISKIVNRQFRAVEGQHPLDRGFDYYFGFNNHSSEYYNSQILYRNREQARAEGYLTEQFTGEALSFIRRSQGKPFFIYLAYNAVHGPMNKPAPEKYRSRFQTGDRQTDNYYAYLNAADEGIGRIRKLLEDEGQAGNTLIMLLSDNGASGGTPLPTNGQFLGCKGQVWQGGLRVPMIAWGPKFAAAGKTVKEMVISLDVMPTALDAAGVKLPAGVKIDGRSLLPLLGGKPQGPVHETLFWAGQLAKKWSGMGQIADELTAPPAWAARKGRWMLHYWSNLKAYELYDLEADPGERHNVAELHPDVIKELKAAYAQWFKGVQKPALWNEEQWRLLAPEA